MDDEADVLLSLDLRRGRGARRRRVRAHHGDAGDAERAASRADSGPSAIADGLPDRRRAKCAFLRERVSPRLRGPRPALRRASLPPRSTPDACRLRTLGTIEADAR